MTTSISREAFEKIKQSKKEWYSKQKIIIGQTYKSELLSIFFRDNKKQGNKKRNFI